MTLLTRDATYEQAQGVNEIEGTSQHNGLPGNSLPSSATEPGCPTSWTSLLNSSDLQGAMAEFSKGFTFDDYALQLNITEPERLRDFLARTFSKYPDAKRKVLSTYRDGDTLVTTWVCTTSQVESFGGYAKERTLNIRFPGVTIERRSHGKVVALQEYYDQHMSRRYAFALSFNEEY